MGITVFSSPLTTVRMTGEIPVVQGSITGTLWINEVTGELSVVEGNMTGIQQYGDLAGNIPVMDASGRMYGGSIQNQLTSLAAPVFLNEFGMEATNTVSSLNGDLPVLNDGYLNGGASIGSDLPVCDGVMDGSFPLVCQMSGTIPFVDGGYIRTGLTLSGELPACCGGEITSTVQRSGSLDGNLPLITGEVRCVVDIRAVIDADYTLPMVQGNLSCLVGSAGKLVGNQIVIRGDMSGFTGRLGSMSGFHLPVIAGHMVEQVDSIGDIVGEQPVITGSMETLINQMRILEHRRFEMR